MLSPELATPYSTVRDRYIFPFGLYEFQQLATNELAPLPRSALYWEPGLGKTAGSTHCALYHMEMGCDTTLVLLPPLLIVTWQRWLNRVKHADGRPLKVTVYAGTPTQRKEIKLDGEFILMSLPIFKKDFQHIEAALIGRRLHIIVDEAHCLKDVSTANHKMVRDYSMDKSIQLLTGTPLNNPMDAYGYIKLISPSIYRSLAQFTRIHVEEVDFFDKPKTFCNLELLSSNLMVNADRKTKEQVLLDLPPLIPVQIPYTLHPKHLKLYREMVNEQLLKLPDGEKLDLTQASALYHAMGQLIMQWHHFSGDDSLWGAGYDLVSEVLDELGDKKLIVFGYYRRTNEALVKKFKCPGVWGDIPAKQKQRALDQFLNDPKCRLIVLQPVAAGQGIDGLQEVCNDALYVEPPVTPLHYTQSVSRVHRDGQMLPVTARFAMAEGTVQKYLVDRLTEKEALVNPLQGSRATLREALFGE